MARTAKRGAAEAVGQASAALVELGPRVHAHPEPAFEEQRSAGRLADALTVTEGGEAANVLPGEAAARSFVRAPSLARPAKVEPRIMACFEAGAVATGAELVIEALGPGGSTEAVLDGARAMAWTAFDAATTAGLGGRLLGRDTSYGDRDDYPWRFSAS